MYSIAQLVVTYLLGVLTIPLLLIATAIIIYIHATATHKHIVFDKPSIEPPITPIANANTSPYGNKRSGWLRITRSLGPNQPPDLTDTSTRLTDIVAKGISKWMQTKRNNSNDGKSVQASDTVQPDMYFVVLDGDTLVMYDNEAMGECRGVIIVSKHSVSLYQLEGTTESQVYSRRTPIRLSPADKGVEDGMYRKQMAEYYIYVERPTDKEDWYFALTWSSLSKLEEINTEELTPPNVDGIAEPKKPEMTAEQKELQQQHMRRSCLVPDSLGIRSILQTISDNHGRLRSDEWLNAILGRVFVGAYKTEWARKHLMRKMQTKFDRVPRPAFIDKITVADLEIGDNVPIITDPQLESFDEAGQVDTSMYVHYMGGFRMVLDTGVKLGSLRLSVALSVELESLSGKMLLRFKPSPSNRFWTGFYKMPSIKLKLSPVLMQKRVKYASVSLAIERQIYEILRQTLVLPNMDDTVFFPTLVEDGGIFERSLKEFVAEGLDSKEEEEKEKEKEKEESDIEDEQSSSARSVSNMSVASGTSQSVKSTISTSAASLFKKAKESQAAESAKTWWQSFQSTSPASSFATAHEEEPVEDGVLMDSKLGSSSYQPPYDTGRPHSMVDGVRKRSNFNEE